MLILDEPDNFLHTYKETQEILDISEKELERLLKDGSLKKSKFDNLIEGESIRIHIVNGLEKLLKYKRGH